MVTSPMATTNSADESLRWEVRLGDGAGGKRFVVAAVATFVGVGATALSLNWITGLVAVAVIFASTTELFLPIRYSLDRNGATSRCGMSVNQIEWERVQRMIETDDGIKLSPFSAPSRLEAFRGVYLRFAGNRDEILAKLREFRGGR